MASGQQWAISFGRVRRYMWIFHCMGGSRGSAPLTLSLFKGQLYSPLRDQTHLPMSLVWTKSRNFSGSSQETMSTVNCFKPLTQLEGLQFSNILSKEYIVLASNTLNCCGHCRKRRAPQTGLGGFIWSLRFCWMH